MHIIKDNKEKVLVKNIYCVGRNYKKHAEELGNKKPTEPFFFQKSLSSLNGGNKIVIPKNRKIDHEVEIVLLIGKNGQSENKDDAASFIEAYSLGIDLTDRTYQNKLKELRLPWLLSKSFKGAAVVCSFSEKPIEEDFWISVNNEKKQKGNQNEMIFSFVELIHFLSNKVPLMAGDLIFTGTPHGVGPLIDGDEVVVGLGKSPINKITVSSEE